MPTLRIDLVNFNRLIVTARRILDGKPDDNSRELAEDFLVFATRADPSRVAAMFDKVEARRQSLAGRLARELRGVRK